MKVNLSEKSKAEFIDHISKQSINCWFDGDDFVMPSGQGKVSKGIVLYQLSVWQLKQIEVDQLNKVLDERTKEWLEAIECGTYFQNVAEQLKAELEEKDKRIESLERQLKRSMIAIEDGEIDWALKNIKKALRGSNANS